MVNVERRLSHSRLFITTKTCEISIRNIATIVHMLGLALARLESHGIDRMVARPKVLIIDSPNGAGKTIFATEYLPNEGYCRRFVNADLIAAGLSPFDPDGVQFRAGRLMLELITALTEERENFAIETTMSGRLYQRWITLWRSSDYRVENYFLYLDSPSLGINRAKARVRAGGHDIPENIVRRRYERGWREFKNSCRDLVDDCTVFDTSSVEPKSLSRKQRKLDSANISELRDRQISEKDGVLTALHKAARVVHRRAAEQGDRVAIWRDGRLAWIDPLVETHRGID